MNVITQFFRSKPEVINNFLSNIIKKISSGEVSKVFIFTDTKVHTNNNKILIFNKRTRLKWSSTFNFIIGNDMINKEGCYIIDPTINILNFNFKKYVSDGIFVNNNYVYCKNIIKNYNVNRFIFTDYDFLKLNINGRKFKVASICHIYYEDLLDQMIEINKNLYKMDFDVDFYFTLTEGSSTIGQKEWVVNKLRENFKGCDIHILPNKGLDIGPFLITLDKIYHKKYDYIFKTHTKKSLLTSGKYFGSKWRNSLFIILNLKKLEEVKQHMENRSEMIGSSKWIIPIEVDNFNKNIIEGLIKDLRIEKTGSSFVGGTMFCVKHDILRKYLNKEKIKKYYDLMEDGYFYQVSKDDSEYLTHSFERVFGMMCGKINGI